MTLGIHIALALVSLLYSTYVAVAPTSKKLKFSYALIFGTLASGVLLGLGQEVNIVQTCISGLAYTGFVLVSTLLAKRRIASAES